MSNREIVALPSVLPGNLDLEALNHRLRSGEAQLDWSHVTEAPTSALATTLAGLHWDDDGLGLASVPPPLMADIATALDAAAHAHAGASRHTRRRDRKAADTEQAAAPALWSTSAAAPDVTPSVADDAHELTKPSVDVAGTPNVSVQPSDAGTGALVLRPKSRRELRAALQEMVRLDLLGPVGGDEEEIAGENVSERYVIGLLAPRSTEVDPGEQDALGVSADESVEDGDAEPAAAVRTTLFPSSFGLTCCIAGQAQFLNVTARWGKYERVKSETLTDPKTGNAKTVWKRHPAGGVIERLPLREGVVVSQSITSVQPDVVLRGEIRRLDENWIVTLFLVNDQEPLKQNKDAAWLFQPELMLESSTDEPIFRRHSIMDRYQRLDPVDQREQRALAMLYRKRVEFAVGHGVSVHAITLEHDPTIARRIETRIVPMYELPNTISPEPASIPRLGTLPLDMKILAEIDTERLVEGLSSLPEAYGQWIVTQAERITDPQTGLIGHEQAIEETLAACRVALERIRAGIALLSSDAHAAEAFRFMNQAMWQQRVHTLAAEAARRGEKREVEAFDEQGNRTWRLFQLAFILLNLPALTDLHHPDRSDNPDAVADLLWFPTGGGKTEAYLGLTAYTLAMRRLQGGVAGRSGEAGVAVLMRYTLRLLTLQQFQRASALICACERIRQVAVAHGDLRWGSIPFRLGLWVGQRTTPNYTKQSAEAIRQDHGHFNPASSFGGSGSPAQLTNCPWCGASIDPTRHIKVSTVEQGTGRTAIYCGDPLGVCPFSERKSPGEGLPVLVVDEEIYRLLPALVIATVDKFAQLPWKGPVGMLFGQVNGYCPRHGYRSPDLDDSDSHPARNGLPAVKTQPCAPLRPPDLIIQDELHLISGPLGTLVGLYETAVDRLVSWEVNGKTIRPKVIASTATVRRASEQTRALFLRSVQVFPPQGLDVEDNFFSRQVTPSDEYPGRLYLGICAFGRRMKLALIRIYAAYLLAAQTLFQDYGALVDPWMTLVGYFNSMRELAGMRRLVDENVRTALQHGEEHGFARRQRPNLKELTSRIGALGIPQILDLMEVAFTPSSTDRTAVKGGSQLSRTPHPLDVLLATNMISVGVDVKRLGLMVVADQPKTTAEYIQATSRVGRAFPGLVCTVFNWARPRDLSHYETFEHYHATFYAQVEALSITPFAPRALDRGLSAILVALIRQQGTEFNSNARAGAITSDNPYIRRAVAELTQRAAYITGRSDVPSLVKDELRDRLDYWLREAADHSGGRVLGYQEQNDGKTLGLLHAPDLKQWQMYTCLNSLRDVEPTVSLMLDDRPIGDESQRAFAPPPPSAAAQDEKQGGANEESGDDL